MRYHCELISHKFIETKDLCENILAPRELNISINSRSLKDYIYITQCVMSLDMGIPSV